MSAYEMFPEPEIDEGGVRFTPTRQAGLVRLKQFAVHAGRRYATQRNFDFGPEKRGNVSALSPWIRHRMITEEEILAATLAYHSADRVQKFVQELFWRTYFKGWLEQHPSVWTTYQDGLREALNAGVCSADYADAIAGRTGIDCFDYWARELVETGYLHNHARMWFASIWIFTLRLPWELGADFFLRHLLDGDPASNTLSWRWIGGLHTKGKIYLACAENIAKYTDGRFNPHRQLSTFAEPLSEAVLHPLIKMQTVEPFSGKNTLLVVTEEDCQIETKLPNTPVARLGLLATKELSPLALGDMVKAFARAGVEEACGTASSDANWTDQIITAAEAAGAETVVTAYAPVGPVARKLATLGPTGLKIRRIRRGYDNLLWPHCTKGFFGLKKKIPKILSELGMAA
ncbi:MAG: FAD-binding domain-containing protein [Rhodospirillaceae bacterium]|nr:FAD-binding domain-containing protein [Rhodospirillaceae bacterium]